MCGRYCIAASPGEITERYGVVVPQEYRPRYNVAPGQMILTITSEISALTEWGVQLGEKNRIINARVESIHEKPLFKNLFTEHRCLIPASGYYEWKHEGSHKIPYYFSSVSGGLLSFAGLIRPGKEGIQVVILTTAASAPYSAIHDRMPVTLDGEAESLYLAEGEISSIPGLQMYEVSSWVNQGTIDTPDLIKPVKKSFVQQHLEFS